MHTHVLIKAKDMNHIINSDFLRHRRLGISPCILKNSVLLECFGNERESLS